MERLRLWAYCSKHFRNWILFQFLTWLFIFICHYLSKIFRVWHIFKGVTGRNYIVFRSHTWAQRLHTSWLLWKQPSCYRTVALFVYIWNVCLIHIKTSFRKKVCYVKPKLLLVLYIIAALDMPHLTNLRISKIMKKTAKTAVREVEPHPPKKGYFWTNKGRVIIRYNKYPRYLRINTCNAQKYSQQQSIRGPRCHSHVSATVTFRMHTTCRTRLCTTKRKFQLPSKLTGHRYENIFSFYINTSMICQNIERLFSLSWYGCNWHVTA
jgi:hypothetical protein